MISRFKPNKITRCNKSLVALFQLPVGNRLGSTTHPVQPTPLDDIDHRASIAQSLPHRMIPSISPAAGVCKHVMYNELLCILRNLEAPAGQDQLMSCEPGPCHGTDTDLGTRRSSPSHRQSGDNVSSHIRPVRLVLPRCGMVHLYICQYMLAAAYLRQPLLSATSRPGELAAR